MSFYEGKKILVTGGSGMIGSHLVEALIKNGANVRIVEHNNKVSDVFSDDQLKKIEVVKGDLSRMEDCAKAVKDMEFVFHLAAVAGGVGKNIANPAKIFTQNILMQTQLLEASRVFGVDRYLFTSSACIYPAFCRLPFKEEDGFKGDPEPSNVAYSWVKRMGELQCQYYKQQYGMKTAIVRPFNSYGPRDNFDLETSHVIPAIIRKAVERQTPFKVWGSGEPTREFVHAADIARGMMLALEKYAEADPVNIASGREIRIIDLVKLILKLSGYENAKIVFEKNRPLGQLKRLGSTEKAKRVLGFETEISLEDGLKQTIEWYKNEMSNRGK